MASCQGEQTSTLPDKCPQEPRNKNAKHFWECREIKTAVATETFGLLGFFRGWRTLAALTFGCRCDQSAWPCRRSGSAKQPSLCPWYLPNKRHYINHTVDTGYYESTRHCTVYSGCVTFTFGLHNLNHTCFFKYIWRNNYTMIVLFYEMTLAKFTCDTTLGHAHMESVVPAGCVMWWGWFRCLMKILTALGSGKYGSLHLPVVLYLSASYYKLCLLSKCSILPSAHACHLPMSRAQQFKQRCPDIPLPSPLL